MANEDALNIYTDGSMYSGPRVGGLGVRIVTFDESGEEEIQDYPVPGYKNATNNSMELYACVVGLRHALKHPRLPEVTRICIFSDSRYVVDNSDKAKFQWPGQKWFTASGTPVLNADLWKQLVRELRKIRKRVEFRWIGGHSKDVHNRAVDKMAKASAKRALNRPLSVVAVRRKQTERSVEVGSIEMKRQRLRIRVITSEWLRVQRLSKYKYEVLSERSKYFRNVDIIYSEHDMKAGHHYEVSVNDDTSNPRVTAVLREIEGPVKPTVRLVMD